MASITYSSTRGGQKNLDFRTVVMTGLAHDRGLFVPDSFPKVSAEELASWKSLSYKDLAVEVIRKFVGEDQVPYEKLKDIVGRSCDAFRSKDVTPIIEVGGHAVLVSETKQINITKHNAILPVVSDQSLLFIYLFISTGIIPRPHIRLQRRCIANAGKLFRVFLGDRFQRGQTCGAGGHIR